MVADWIVIYAVLFVLAAAVVGNDPFGAVTASRDVGCFCSFQLHRCHAGTPP